MSESELYSIWQGIKTRCSNSNAINYHNYGGRGIVYDSRWGNFENFYNDMAEGFKPGLTIERIDNSQGYYKENCKWATTKEQSKNKRWNCLLTYNGKTQIITDWATELGFNKRRLYYLKEHIPIGQTPQL